jgi:RNAse (barnase) inhibitor barstar
MYLKGSADDYDRDKLNQDLQQKFDFHEKKKRILDAQYDKSQSTLQTIKKYL